MSLAAKYRKSFEDKWAVRFKTLHPDGDAYNGIVVLLRRMFVVLKAISDFEFDGFVVLPKRVITGYRDSDFEALENEIIQKKYILNELRAPNWLWTCLTLRDLLETLERHRIWPGVEVLFNDGKESAFYLGPITEVKAETFSLYCYDGAGHWEKEYKMDYGDILKIQFGDKYSRYFNKYMKQSGGPPTP